MPNLELFLKLQMKYIKYFYIKVEPKIINFKIFHTNRK